jgi:iron(III) transport system substrate-binding protein
VVTVYTTLDAPLLQDLEARVERELATVDVQWVPLPGGEILARLRAERSAPRADLWFGGSADRFDRAAVEGLLAPMRPSWSADVPAAWRDPQDRWHPVFLRTVAIAYHPEALEGSPVPRELDDLAGIAWRGRLVLRDPRTREALRAVAAAVMLRSLRETGGTDAGRAWLERLDANVRGYTDDAAVLVQRLGRREAAGTIDELATLAPMAARTGVPLVVAVPTRLRPAFVDGIAVVAGAPHPDDAGRVYAALTDAEALRAMARRHQAVSVRDGPARAAVEGDLPSPAERRLLADSLDAWMAAWEQVADTRPAAPAIRRPRRRPAAP